MSSNASVSVEHSYNTYLFLVPNCENFNIYICLSISVRTHEII